MFRVTDSYEKISTNEEGICYGQITETIQQRRRLRQTRASTIQHEERK